MASASEGRAVSGLEVSRFSGSVKVRKSRFSHSIFDDRISLWSDVETVLREAIPLGNINRPQARIKISPDSSKVLMYDHNSKTLLLFNAAKYRQISRLDMFDEQVDSEMSFSSDGSLVAFNVVNINRGTSKVLVLSIPSLEIVRETLAVGISHDKCKFMQGDNSRILILHQGQSSSSLFMCNMVDMSRVWQIDNVCDQMFELTNDCSKVLLTITVQTPEGKQTELILADTKTGEKISGMIYPKTDKIDCAVFSDDESKLVISINNGTFIQTIKLPEFVIVRQSDEDVLGRILIGGQNVTRMILSPDANLVMRMEWNNISVVDLTERRLKGVVGDTGVYSAYDGAEVSSDGSMVVLGVNGVVSLMHARSRDERRLTAFLEAMFELMLASRRRHIRLPSEIWCMVFEEFIRDTLL